MTPTLFSRLAATAGLAFAASGVGAQSIEDARFAYEDGDFVEAADIAEKIGTSEAYAVAAMSLAVYAYYEASEEEWEEVVGRAMRMGELAVEADSTNPDAYYQSAHAVGRYAQGKGAWTALREGLAGKIRDLLDATLAIDPDYVHAILALAGWHADIHAEGFIARRMYGGKKEEAIRLFERALELAPESKVVLHAYAIRLPNLDEENGMTRALEMLEKALALPVPDAHLDYVHLDVLQALDDLRNR